MPIVFHIAGALRPFAGGRDRIEIAGTAATAADALEALWAVCPALRDRVETEEGAIREHVNVFVGQENVRYTGGLATALGADAEISIFPAISGGERRGHARAGVAFPVGAGLAGLVIRRRHRHE